MTGLEPPVSGFARLVRSRRGRPLRALQHRAFAVLWSSYLVTQVGFWVSQLGLQWLVTEETDADAFQLGLLMFFSLLPLLLVTPIGGMVADRVERKRVVVASQLGVAVAATALGVVVIAGATMLAVVYLFAFVLGTALAMNTPAAQAVLANAVPVGDLPSAISLQAMGGNFARVAGPSLAAPVLARWGAGPAFLVYAGAALFTAWSIGRISIPRVELRTDEQGVVARIRRGFEHARERPPALMVLFLVGVSAVFGSSYIALLPLFAKEVLDDADVFPVLVVATAVGAVLGAFLVGYREGPTTVTVAALQVVALGASLGLLGLSGGLVPSLALATVTGACNFAALSTLNSMIQHVVDEDKRGRVMSLFVVCWGGLFPIGGLLVGTTADVAGLRSAYVGFAAVCVAIASIVAVRARLVAAPPPPALDAG